MKKLRSFLPGSLTTIAMSWLIIIICGSCLRSNKLETNEEILIKSILVEEEEKARMEKSENEDQISKESPVGISFQEEDRGEDQDYPLERLDILRSREVVKHIQLSNITEDLQYILLRIPGDTSFLGGSSQIVFTPNYIYVKGVKGLACFDRSGEFLKLICETTTDHVTLADDGRTAYVSSESIKLFYGSMGDINAIGDRLVYLYKDYPNEINQLMMFDPGKDINAIALLNSGEENRKGNPIGNVLRSFDMKYKGTNLYPLDENTFGTIPGKLGVAPSGGILVTKTYRGDTACVFTDYDPVSNYSNTVARGVESGDKYYINGQFNYRPRFNDTIFRLEMPNRLIPRYYIDFGDRGISSSVEGLNPKYSLKDKFVHNDIIETANHLFIQYTQDYSCPNTARNGTLKYNRCIYFKNNGELIHIMLDAAPVQQDNNSWPSTPKIGLTNDIDYGLEFWPDGITNEGLPYELISGKLLNDKIRKKGTSSKALIDLANEMKPKELLIVLIK